jgi:type III restriction enzyme
MGLRAFTSQLLCEQVVGRGLRRTSYEVNPDTGLFEAEYVNIFGVPFTFLPHESHDDHPPPPPPPKTRIEPVTEKQQYEIRWPNIIRIDHVYRPRLNLDLNTVKTLGKPDVTRISEIDLDDLSKNFRMQKIIFEAARDVFDQMKPNWAGSKAVLLAQLIRLIDNFIISGKIKINPPLFQHDDVKRRILITLNMNKVVQHIWEAIRFENTESIEPVFDSDNPIRSTGDMRPWYTGKPCEKTKRTHMNFCVYDSTWEASEAFELDRNHNVEAWVKNDHLGFEILYIFKGVVRKYRPDFIIRLKTGKFLILETKGQETERDKTKREFLDEWVRAVNEHGGFGIWQGAVSKNPADVAGILEKEVSK